jgi:hypothetical protein
VDAESTKARVALPEMETRRCIVRGAAMPVIALREMCGYSASAGASSSVMVGSPSTSRR